MKRTINIWETDKSVWVEYEGHEFPMKRDSKIASLLRNLESIDDCYYPTWIDPEDMVIAE